MTPTASDAQRMAQVIQAMAKDAGFDVKIQSTEFATALKLSDQGQYEAFLLAWSGRADPDGNLHIFLACKGPLNNAGWCKPEPDAAIEKARVCSTRRSAPSCTKPWRRMSRRTGRSSTCSIATGCGRTTQAHRPAYRARRHGARAGLEDELRQMRRSREGVFGSPPQGRRASDQVLKFLLRRLATVIPTLFFVSVLIFGLQQLLPGDPAIALAGEERDPEQSGI